LARRPLAISTTVVVSQVYGGGGNSGATYTHDFIGLFNRGSSPASVAGWSVQYASATGTRQLRLEEVRVAVTDEIDDLRFERQSVRPRMLRARRMQSSPWTRSRRV
jgi:hypothetical protein